MEKKLQKHIPQITFIDSAKFMESSISNFVNNITQGVHKIKYKYGHNDKKYETSGIKYKDCECCL